MLNLLLLYTSVTASLLTETVENWLDVLGSPELFPINWPHRCQAPTLKSPLVAQAVFERLPEFTNVDAYTLNFFCVITICK